MATVELIQKPVLPLNTVTFACKQCTEWTPIYEYSNERLVQSVIKSGHMSVLEHITYTFRVICSRACSHQLVRHRLATYSQFSQRYDKTLDHLDFVRPNTLRLSKLQNDVAFTLNDYIVRGRELYEMLINEGIPAEDARYILPEGISTALVVTMNGRELFHFFGERLCNRAQWEIREIASKMYQICKEDCPEIFTLAGPKCVVNGHCNEVKSCGYYKALTKDQSSDIKVEA